MHLHSIDWAIIIAYLLLALYIGIKLRGKASGSLSNFFLGGRKLPWYIAGISMVATTFAADTPLWVTEVVSQHGISGNWLWWNMLIGGMLTVFFFARYWRRAGILTELELIEMRYSGKPAAWLRGFKSVYMGIFLNVIVIGWVNYAFITIIQVFFNIEVPPDTPWYANQLLLIVFAAMFMVAVYSSISGLLGVAITDAVQFVLAMVGCIILAYMVLDTPEVGGIAGLKEKLPAWRFSFFPNIGANAAGLETLSISIGAFLTFGMVQWWASWYPGAEPGGGGYIAQRMMSAKSEKDSVYAALFFQIAHYCFRPWPWIIVALCVLVLYPNLEGAEAGQGFVMAMRDHLPVGLKGLLLVAFLAAYMSTISTQLNWGASYLTNDLYKRFLAPESSFKSEEEANKKYVKVGRVFTLLIMLIAVISTAHITSIDAAAKFLISAGAGLGMVLILRWYWWRINAWTEITATIAPFVPLLIMYFFKQAKIAETKVLLGPLASDKIIADAVALDYPWLEFPYSFLIAVAFSTIMWIIVLCLTKPSDEHTLISFYKKVRPAGNWTPIKAKANIEEPNKKGIGWLVVCWLSSVLFTYSMLFLIGYCLFLEWPNALISFIAALLFFVVFWVSIKRSGAFEN